MGTVRPKAVPEKYGYLRELRGRKDLVLPSCRFWNTETALRPYQAVGVMHLLLTKRFVLGDDTGLGKTVQSIAAMGHTLEADSDYRFLVVAPKSATLQWASEFRTFAPGMSTIVARSVPKPRRRKIYQSYLEGDIDVLILNYGLLKADQKWLENMLGVGKYWTFFDEATSFKNVDTQTYRTCRKLSDLSERVTGMSATPVKNRLEEAYWIFRCVTRLLMPSSKVFSERFVKTEDTMFGKKIVGYKRLAEFRELIDPFFLGRRKTEVPEELPDLIPKEVPVSMSRKQAVLYDNALTGAFRKGDKIVSTIPISAMTYCQMICDAPELVGNNIPSPKEVELFRLLENEFLGEKVIIFTVSEKWITILEGRMRKKGMFPLRITGKEGEQEREDAKNLFRDSERHNVILIDEAGSESINLQAASAMIFLDLPWSYGDFLQTVGRAQRIGSRHESIVLAFLIARGTIDEHKMEILREEKKPLFDSLFGEAAAGAFDFEDEPSLIRDAMRSYAMRSDAARKKGYGLDE